MKVKVGVSSHHVHLTEEDYQALFKDEVLEKRNDLTQPGQFASNKTVDLVGKHTIEKVRVLGPLRNYTQVEVAVTDAYRLGINPPIRTSGDLDGAAVITIRNGENSVTKPCCIIANRHIHITKEDKERLQLNDVVKVKINNEKGAILDHVFLKVLDEAYFELHLDTDDANANLIKEGDEVEIINE